MRFTFVLLICPAVCGLANAQALPEQPADIGYPTPAAALMALRAKPGVVIMERSGWTVAEANVRLRHEVDIKAKTEEEDAAMCLLYVNAPAQI